MEVDDQLTEGKRRTVRVHIAIIDYFTQILRDLLSSKIAAKDLYKNHVLGKYKKSDKGKNLGLWEEIFKREGHLEIIKKATDYADFDITFLYQCLRNFCTWPPNEEPTSGWGSKHIPATGEETVGDDIERIRILRNKFYGHIKTFEISDQEYEDCWTIITDVCERMEKHLVGTSYCQDIKRLEKQRVNLDLFQDMKNFIAKNMGDIEKLVKDAGKTAKDNHHEVITYLEYIKEHIMQNPGAETEQSRALPGNVYLIVAAVFVVVIAVFTSYFGQDRDEGKNDNSSIILIMGLIAIAVVIMSVMFVRPASRRKRSKNDRDILGDSNLADLAGRLGSEYVMFLYHLNLNTPEIDQIKVENPSQIIDQTMKGLSLWRDKEQNKHYEELVGELFNALEKVDRNDLVDEITQKNKFQVTLSGCRKEENDVVIVCKISSISNLSFSVTWEKDGCKIDVDENKEKYRGVTNCEPSLKIYNFDDDYGRYQCFVSSVMGTFGSKILNMNPPFVRELTPVHLPGEPTSVVIQCDVLNDDSLRLSNIIWMKDDVEIGEKNKYSGGHTEDPSLTIINAGIMDRGIYTCVAENIIGVGKSTVSLDVPEVKVTGPSAINFEERAIFSATVSSNLKITSYTWQQKIPNRTPTTLDTDEETNKRCSIDKLVINGANLNDTAEYRLLVTNILGEGKSDGIMLTVKEDIFGKNELWKNDDKCDGITKEDRLKLYRKLFWNRQEKRFSCTFEELLKHLDPQCEYESLESQDDSTDFDSEDSEKITLWDFLHENGDVSKNIKFWFAKSSDNSMIEKYCVSPKYSRQEPETAICIPSEFLQEFVKKLDFNILKHRTMNDESIYPCVSDILKIPTEILYSGDDAIQNYLKQLSRGTVKVYHARGMIVGCAGAGKTTLLKKLKDLPIEDIRDTKSTRGIEIQADVFTVSGKEITVTSEKILTHFNIKESTTTMTETLFDKQALENSPDELQTNLVESGPINEQENSTHRRTDESKDQSFLENTSDNGEVNKLSFENTHPDSQLTVQTERRQLEVVGKKALGGSDDNVLNMQEKQELEPIQLLSLLAAIKDNTIKTITIFDFAGQLAYYVTHQIYLSPRAFYVLVIDMTKNLDDLVKEGALFVKWTYKELIQHWMKMIHAIHRSAPVIPVATHAEGKSKEDIKKFFVQIWNLIPEDIQKSHLDYKHEFAVELENSFGIANIKECISNTVSNTKHWGEFRPSSWVMFENYLMKAKMKIKVMKFEDLWTENKKLDSEYQLENKDDMTKMLQFFHDTGTILYIDEDVLRDDIILDVPWFVDAFKHIITDPVHATEDLARIRDTFSSENFACKKALDDLKESGILSVSLVRAVWKLYENMKSDKKDAYDTYVQNMQGIMRYMERLGMIAKITNNPEEMWYVPCMNSKPFPEDKFKNYSVSSTVCFKFKFLPPSIYYQLIASCINRMEFTILDWPDPVYFHKNAVLLYKAAFDYKYYFLIGNVELQNTIEIQVLIGKGFEVERKNSSAFKNDITDQLNRLTKTFHTNLERFEIGYRCRNTIFSDKTAAHFIPEFEFKDSAIKCPECKPPHRILCEDVLYPWNKEGEIADRNNEDEIRYVNVK